MQPAPMSFEAPPRRTDDICIGRLQLASTLAAEKAKSLRDPACVMWAQVDEVGILFRGVRMEAAEFKKARSEIVRWDDLQHYCGPAIAEALNKLAAQLSK